MKKISALLLCALMCLSLAFGMTACGDEKTEDKGKPSTSDKGKPSTSDKGASVATTDQERIVGKWMADVVFDKEFLSAIAGDDDADSDDFDEMLQSFDLSGLSIKVYMEFKEDGTARMYTNEADAEEFINSYVKVMSDGMLVYMKAMVENMGYDFNDYLAESGMTEQEFVDSLMANMDTNEIKREIIDEITDSNGYYKLENGKLYTSDDKDFDADDAVDYTLTDTVLTFTKDGIKLTFNKQ